MPPIQNVGENVMTQSAEGVINIMQQQAVHPQSTQSNQPASTMSDPNVPVQYSQTSVASRSSSPPNATSSSESPEKSSVNLQAANYPSELSFLILRRRGYSLVLCGAKTLYPFYVETDSIVSKMFFFISRSVQSKCLIV